jgi:HK97 family phage portal protein
MGLIETISRGALGLRADVSGTPAPWDDYWYNPLGSASASGMRITEASAKRIATVLACVGVIGRNLGMMPVKIYTEAPDGSKKLVDHHPLYDVLYSRPNGHQTAFEFKQMMQGHLELRGNAYAEIIPGKRGAVDQLIPMHPDRVHVERLKPSGRLRYVYNDPLTDNTRNLVEEEVFHLRNFCDDSAVGQSTIGMACDTFGVALAQQDYSARFLKNDARPPFVFEGTNFKTKEDRSNFIKSWQEGQTGANRGKAGILPVGVTIKELGIKPIDQQLLDARKFSRIEICSIFGVPPHLIGETEKTATYASVEQFNIMYAVHCILPRLVLWEQAIQRDLLTSTKYFAKFSMAALLRGDTASRFNAYHTAIGDGWLNQDEVRALEDMNPSPNGVGRNYWRPVNWALLSQTAQPAAPAAEADDNADADDDDPNAGEGGTDTGNDGVSGETKRLRLEALAAAAADRCVRKQVNGLRKMLARGPYSNYQLREFLASHAKFVGEVLNLDPDGLSTIEQRHFEQMNEIEAALSEGGSVGAFGYIDRIAATEPLRLAKLITGGMK